MPNKSAIQQQLLAENEGLRVLLGEAEETLREIRSGELDALMVSGAAGAQLFTLKDADQSFRLLVEQMSEGALTMTAQGVIVYANRSFAGLLKTPLEKVMGSGVRTWIAPDSQPILQSLLEKGAGGARHGELSLAAGDGTRVLVHVSVSHLPIAGMPDAYCLVAIDLTEHNRIEAIAASERVARELLAAANQSRGELQRIIEEKTRIQQSLQESESRYRASELKLSLVLENMTEGVVLIDAQGDVLYQNPASLRMAGFDMAEKGLVKYHEIPIIWKVWDEQGRELDVEEWPLSRVARGERVQNQVLRTRRIGTSIEFFANYSGVPIYDEEGKFIVGSLVIRDITERKRAADELLESRQRLDGIIHSAMDAIVVVDEDLRIVMTNTAAEAAFGYLCGELQGKPLDLLLPESFRVAHTGQIKAFDNSGVTSRRMGGLGSVTGLRKNGEEFPLEATISVDRSTGKPLFTAILRDISERLRTEAALYKSSERLELATRSANLGIWELDLAANHLIWDAQMFELYGIREQDFSGAYEAWTSGLHPDDRARGDADIAAAVAGEREFDLEFRVVWPNGEVRDIEAHGLVQRDAAGVATRMVGVNRDITQRKQADARIAYLNRVHAVLSGINTLIVHVQDHDQLFRDACRVALEAGGFRMAMIFMLDRSAMKIVPVASAGKDEGLLTAINGLLSSSADVEKFMVARAIQEKQTVVSNDTLGDSGVSLGKQYVESGVRSMAVFPLLVADEAVGAIALYAHEIEFFHEEELGLLTELASDIAFAIDHIDKQDRLQFLAHFDPLTGLANRALFNERLSQYMKDATGAGRKIAIGLIDLERFKNINDTLGRGAGDELLKQMSEWGLAITGDARLQARLDADHFAILLPEDAWGGDLPGLAENMMVSFRARSFHLKGVEFLMGAKAGLAVFPDDGADPDTLFKNAESALKKAKSSGDRLLFYSQKMSSDVVDRLAMENRLRQACQNDEFVLHYQPKVDLATGRVTGAEALIRWNDPFTGRLVPPGLFIPILEETGMILEVGRWALGQAIKDLLRWSSATVAGFRVAVNVSELQLRNIKFVEEIRQLIAVDPRAAAGLELEITEGIVMYDIDGNIQTLKSIRDVGVTIAIDDFGTGFSSLGSLAKLPLDTLKIDRSFVIDMTAGPAGLGLVSTIINLAHGMKLKVVAEGVETEEQSRLLRLLQCDEMQGYLFSKPVPADVFEARFLAGIAEAT